MPESFNASRVGTKSFVGLRFSVKKISSHLINAIVSVDTKTFTSFYKQIIELYITHAKPQGLEHQNLNVDFVKKHYKDNVDKDVKKFIFKHLVFDFLVNEIIAQKIPLPIHPRLDAIEYDPEKNIQYHFNISIATPLKLKDWKIFS